MSGSAKNHGLIRFSVFELDSDSGELFKHGRKIKLQGQPFELLLALLERPGDVLTRDELRQKIWPSDTAGDFDHGLNRAINKVREALGDSAQTPQFIETLPRRGYRFIGSIQNQNVTELPANVEPVVPPLSEANAKTPASEVAPGTPSRRKLVLGLAATAFVAAVAVIVWLGSAPRDPPPLEIRPLTSYPGSEEHPTLSPDGTQVAFSWNGPKQDNYDIYVSLISGARPLRLTTDSALDAAPAWSPDGKYIAFIRNPGPNGELYLVSPLGGPARKISDTKSRSTCWSPDSGSVTVSGATSGLSFVSITNGELRNVTQPPPGVADDDCAFSENGRCIAFVRWQTSGLGSTWSTGVVGSIYVSCPPGATPRRITSQDRAIYGLAWMPGNRELLASMIETGAWRYGLARVSLHSPADTEISPLPWAENGTSPSLFHSSSDGSLRLVYERSGSDHNMYMLDRGPAQDFRNTSPVPVAVSTRYQLDPQFSPEGRKVAFASDRSGEMAIWLSNLDGSDPVQLTDLRTCAAGSPRWAPDSSRVAFDCYAEGNSHVYLVSVEGGPARRLTRDSAEEILPTWSHDCRWIYFSSNRSGMPQVWKAPVSGGAAVQVTRNEGYDSFESPDGVLLYYAKRSVTGLWSVPVTGGSETHVLDGAHRYWWAVADAGIYFVNPDATPRPTLFGQLSFYSFEKRTVSQVGSLNQRLDPESPSLAVSRDGRRILFVPFDAGSDLMLVNNFR